ncbi:MAG: phosphotransferase [Chloroflexi bacterium]|nr:phosphotransferase [Chloroflexota bacterium]
MKAPSLVEMARDFLLRHWAELEMAGPCPPEVLGSLRTSGPGDAVVVFLTDPRGRLMAVAKVAVMPPAAARLRRGFRALSLIRPRLEGNPILASIPRPLALLEAGMETIVVEAPVEGIPLLHRLPEEIGNGSIPRASRYLELAFQWLVDFHQAMARGGGTPPQHGDFCLQNLLWRGKGGVGVVDWEHFGEEYPPMFDIFSLLVSFGELQRRKGKNFLLACFAPGWFSQTTAELVARYASLLGLGWEEMEEAFRQHLEKMGQRMEELYGRHHPYARPYLEALSCWEQHRPALFPHGGETHAD